MADRLGRGLLDAPKNIHVGTEEKSSPIQWKKARRRYHKSKIKIAHNTTGREKRET